MKKSGSQIAKACAMLLCVQTVLTGCGQSVDIIEEDTTVTVDMETAEVGTLTLSNSFIGTISPQETVYVIPMVAGTVTQANFEVGDSVNAGDLLFKIDDASAQLQYQQAALSAKSAELSASSTLGTQQDANSLSIDATLNQAKQGYESAQIGLKSSKDAYNNAKDAVDAAQSAYDGAASYAAAIHAQYPGTVSDNDAQKAVASAASVLASAKSGKTAAETGLLSAQSAYKFAESAIDTANASADIQQGAALEDTEDSLENAMALAGVGVDSAALALSYYTVTAPISGVIESKSIKVNDIASQQSAAYTIVNNNTMTVTFHVSEDVKNTLAIGQLITIDRNGSTYEAAITEIGTSVNAQTGLFQIKACVEVDGNQLPSGVSVKITADTYTAQNQILVPYDAVYYSNDGAYVYTSVDGIATKTPVTTGIFNEDTMAITEGINAGDLVITSWSPKLTGGVKVAAATEADTSDAETAETEAE